jgi:hypothetical protein
MTNKQQIIDAIEAGITAAPSQGVPEWLGATDSLLDLFAQECESFSSGSIAAHLRHFRPDLNFSVTSSVGAHVRNRFDADTMPVYQNADGTVTPVEQVPRTCEGIGRTPPGTSVFVYAPGYTEGMDYDFEIDIPKPGTTVQAESDGLPPIPTQPSTPAAHFVKLAARKSVAGLSLTATVHKNRRCYVPRSAFEELLHETKTGLKGGDSVYVKVDDSGGEAVISLDRLSGAQAYQLVATRGVVQFSHPVAPFTIGDTFTITVDGPGRRLVVDLS